MHDSGQEFFKVYCIPFENSLHGHKRGHWKSRCYKKTGRRKRLSQWWCPYAKSIWSAWLRDSVLCREFPLESGLLCCVELVRRDCDGNQTCNNTRCGQKEHVIGFFGLGGTSSGDYDEWNTTNLLFKNGSVVAIQTRQEASGSPLALRRFYVPTWTKLGLWVSWPCTSMNRVFGQIGCQADTYLLVRTKREQHLNVTLAKIRSVQMQFQ